MGWNGMVLCSIYIGMRFPMLMKRVFFSREGRYGMVDCST